MKAAFFALALAMSGEPIAAAQTDAHGDQAVGHAPGVAGPIEGVILFGGPGFSGEQRVVAADAPDLKHSGFDNRAFSLRVAPGQRWRLCARRAYRGACHIVSASVADLRSIGLGGTLSSLRREPPAP
jgi:hypothetical protein